jgi:hypothetical protein
VFLGLFNLLRVPGGAVALIGFLLHLEARCVIITPAIIPLTVVYLAQTVIVCNSGRGCICAGIDISANYRGYCVIVRGETCLLWSDGLLIGYS